MRLKGKNAIVTGAGAGIGRATALRFAEEGARVMVAELDEGSGTETVEEIRRAGGEAWFHRTDVSDAASVGAMVDAASGNIGPLNTLVNNAAAFVFGKIEEVSADDWAKVLGGERARLRQHGAGSAAPLARGRAAGQSSTSPP